MYIYHILKIFSMHMANNTQNPQFERVVLSTETANICFKMRGIFFKSIHINVLPGGMFSVNLKYRYCFIDGLSIKFNGFIARIILLA